MSTEGPFIVDVLLWGAHVWFARNSDWTITFQLRENPMRAMNDAETLNAAWQDGRERGRQEAAPRWIPCSERMPEKGTRVLATLLTGEMTTLAWWPDTGFWAPGAIGPGPIYRQHTVTHWMPSPDPPKRGEQS